MPIQAFVDDSGVKGSTRHFLMAALVAHFEDWTLFSREWQACLDHPPKIPVFKMSEAAGRKGAFREFRPCEIDDKLRSLVRIIDCYAKFVTYSIIDLEAHSKTWALTNSKSQRDLYFWPFQNTILAIMFDLWDHGWREKFEIIFDDHLIFGRRAKIWYPALVAVAQQQHPEEARLLPDEPSFGSDNNFIPIQAADLYAWCIRRATDDPKYTRFDWLLDELRHVKKSEYSQYYDATRMQSVTDMSHEIVSTAPHIPASVIDAYKTIFNNLGKSNKKSQRI